MPGCFLFLLLEYIPMCHRLGKVENENISVVLSVWCAYISDAVADSFVVDELSAHVDIAMDSVVYENVLFRPELVSVNDTLDFENNGRVYTAFSICDGCEFLFVIVVNLMRILFWGIIPRLYRLCLVQKIGIQ